MLQKDSLFRRREEPPYRGSTPAPAPTPAVAVVERPPHPNPAATPEVTSRPTGAGKPGEGSKLIVGPDVKLKGVEITDCDTLVVEGRVESALDSRVIQIAEHGVFNGTASIDIAEIRGRFEGELTARNQLVIHASSRVSGKIRYGKIKIEEGGEISGDIGTNSPGAAQKR
ncbi:MAG: polymer-forming cytoskeletal protein [Proteobacteria bacterium]|nr:polymer-forming cytoskeletal protein [Pseudomonadota bacterium]